MRKPYIYIHADDYGMTSLTCKRIEHCWKYGCLNSISIMPNGCLNDSADLKPTDKMHRAIHLNLVEGKALTDPKHIPLLVRPDGYMKCSFVHLLFLSISPKRKQFEEQVYLEVKEQIQAVRSLLPEDEPILIDSHQHTHMIPMIFRTILRIVKEEQIAVQYLRVSAEPILPFILEPSLYCTYKPVNLVKNFLLNFLWLFIRKEFNKTGIPSAVFCGIIFSGNMDISRVMAVFPHFYKIAQKRGYDLEFLFHPGYTEPNEPLMDPYKKSFHSFYLSNGRKTENKTLHLKKWCNLIREKNLFAVPMKQSEEAL